MPTKRTPLAAGVAALALVGGGAIAAASASSDPAPKPRYDVVIPDGATAAQREAVDAMLYDTPIPVQDAEGVRRGFVRDSALTGRDGRVNALILGGFREARGAEDPEYDELYEALRVLDPVPVVDEAGSTVGYLTRGFKTAEEIKELTPAAQAMADRMLK